MPELRGLVETAIAFFAQSPVQPLPPSGPFVGPGVYALYYTGPNVVYAPLVRANEGELRFPIYIGKAVPEGSRIGYGAEEKTKKLYSRLSEHARSIGSAADLRLQDFRCRFMIMEGATADLIVPVEAELIRRFRPVWNGIGGFGNHPVGKNRTQGDKAEWDLLHPGRLGAAASAAEQDRLDAALAKIRQHFEKLGFA